MTVDVVVLDDQGRPLRGLARGDFTLFEDGRPQEVVSFEAFEAGEGPRADAVTDRAMPVAGTGPLAGARTFVLLVDDMSMAPHRHEAVRKALGRLLDVGLRDGDLILFATTSGDAWWSARVPEAREDLLALFARIRGRRLAEDGRDAISEFEAFRIVHFEGAGGRVSVGSDGTAPPAGPPTSLLPLAPAGTDTTERVVLRYYERRVCNPDPPAVTPRSQCESMVRRNAQMTDQLRANRTRDVLAAVDRAAFALIGVRGRKALLLLTEGFLNDPDVRGTQDLAGRCREANLVVHSIDVRGLQNASPGFSAADWGTPNVPELAQMRNEEVRLRTAGNEGLAEDTGGFAVRDTNDLEGGAVRVAQESRVYYLLGFAPPDGKGPRDWRKLRVAVKRQGVTVRARKGYTLRSSAEIMAAPPPSAVAVPAPVVHALLAPQDKDEIPLRARAYAFDERPDGTVAVVVAVEADVGRLANLGGDRPRSVVSLSIAVAHRDTGAWRRVDQRVVVEAGLDGPWEGWLALQRELLLPPGIVQARVVVRDEFLGRIGTVTLRFEVPRPSGLRLSTPILSDRLYRPRLARAPQPALLVRRDFGPDARLYCQFQVFGAKPAEGGPRVLASFEMRRPGGEVVRRGDPTPIEPGPDGRLVRLLTLPLLGQAEGAYELVLQVIDQTTGETRETREALRVVSHPG